MHELGVVFKIIDDLKEVAAENDLSRIDSVTIRLGEVSTVIPEYLQDCWKWACRRTPLVEDARLEIETIPAVTYCEDCRQTYPTVRQNMPALRKSPYLSAAGKRISDQGDRGAGT